MSDTTADGRERPSTGDSTEIETDSERGDRRAGTPTAVAGGLRRGRLRRWLRALVTVGGLQAGLALVYLFGTDAGLAAPATLAVPFVWLTAAGVAVWVVDPPAVSTRVWLVAATAGAAYTGLLAWLTGVLSLSSGPAAGLHLVLLPPGWGPMVGWDGPLFAARLVPYRILGYLALGYLVAVVVAETVGDLQPASDSSETSRRACSAAGGIVAISSCAGCSLPVVSWLLGGVGSVALVGSESVGPATYLFATGAYLLAVAALVWRDRVAAVVAAVVSRVRPRLA